MFDSLTAVGKLIEYYDPAGLLSTKSGTVVFLHPQPIRTSTQKPQRPRIQHPTTNHPHPAPIGAPVLPISDIGCQLAVKSPPNPSLSYFRHHQHLPRRTMRRTPADRSHDQPAITISGKVAVTREMAAPKTSKAPSARKEASKTPVPGVFPDSILEKTVETQEATADGSQSSTPDHRGAVPQDKPWMLAAQHQTIGRHNTLANDITYYSKS